MNAAGLFLRKLLQEHPQGPRTAPELESCLNVILEINEEVEGARTPEQRLATILGSLRKPSDDMGPLQESLLRDLANSAVSLWRAKAQLQALSAEETDLERQMRALFRKPGSA
jgi:hypothetical protein